MSGALLDGKVAVVTGGGGGIGRGICESFAGEGARVLVVDIDGALAAESAAAAGNDSLACMVDVRDRESGETIVGTALDRFGRLDILVNNVGHYGSGGRKQFHESTDDEWDALYRVNLAHVFQCSRAALPVMLGHGGGNIINVSTIEAFRAIPTRAVYSAFKAAITGFTRSLAVEYARHAIRVNAIAPDVTETLQVPYSKWLKPEEEELIPQWVPLGRFGQPNDVAGVALFLASDLSQFVTGTTIHVDGGTFASGGWFPTEEGGWTNRPRRP